MKAVYALASPPHPSDGKGPRYEPVGVLSPWPSVRRQAARSLGAMPDSGTQLPALSRAQQQFGHPQGLNQLLFFRDKSSGAAESKGHSPLPLPLGLGGCTPGCSWDSFTPLQAGEGAEPPPSAQLCYSLSPSTEELEVPAL